MKRGLWLIAGLGLLCLFTSCVADAQLSFSVGPRFGFNLAGMSIDEGNQNIFQAAAPTTGGRFGILFGAAGELKFGRLFGAQMELLYVMKGASQDQNAGGGLFGQAAQTQTTTFKINELAIPLLFKVGYPVGPVRLYGYVGPEFGFILSATESVPTANGGTQDIDLKGGGAGFDQFGNPTQGGDQVGGIDFSLDFGSGAEYMVARNIGLTFDIRYVLGLSNIFSSTQQANQQVQQAVVTPSWKTHGFQILLGAMFRVG